MNCGSRFARMFPHLRIEMWGTRFGLLRAFVWGEGVVAELAYASVGAYDEGE